LPQVLIQKVVPGKVIEYYYEEDFTKTEQYYLVNSLCLFKVVDQDNNDHHFATGWLDCALKQVRQEKKDRQKLIETIIIEIKRSIPLTPIQLTSMGDNLCECPPRPKESEYFKYFVNHTRDNDPFGPFLVGIHQLCNGWMERIQATKTHDVILCRKCCLRIPIPKEIRTYGDLRKIFTSW